MRRVYFVLASIVAIATMIAALPLAWVAPKFIPDIAGKNLRYSGTIWQGSVSGVDLLDRLNFQLKPQSLFSPLPLRINAGNGVNKLAVQIGRKRLKGLDLQLNVAELPLPDQRLAGLEGMANILVSKASFDALCHDAEGRVRTDILQKNKQKFAWTGPHLEGPISCQDGNVVFDLSGRDSTQAIEAKITVETAGGYKADITVQTSQAEAAAVLPLFGFSQTPQGFKLTEQGKWR